jgi:uncharacterized protein (TIGR03435 family)
VTVGWLHPSVLLPLEWREWDRERLDAVLAHEGAHVRRRDGLVASLAEVNRCVFWFHPLAWMLERKLALLAEQACDESSVVSLGDRKRYAHLLLEMALRVDGSQGRLRRHALTMASGSHIRQRIDSLLQEGRTFSRGLTWTGWAAVMLCGIPVVLGAGAVELDRQPPLPQLKMSRWNVPAPAFPDQKVAEQKRVLLAQARPGRPAPSPEVAVSQAQSPTPLRFEVASVRPAGSRPPYTPIQAAGEITGGPGTGDPTRMIFTWVLPRRLLMAALALPLDQISGSGWVMGPDARFDISANVPPGATKEQANEMLLNLLKKRFHLTYHSEKKDFDAYALVVAKGGPKLKDASPADGPLPEAQPGTFATAGPLDRQGFPQLPAGRSDFRGTTENGVTREAFRMVTLQQLSNMLQFMLKGSRIVDKTGLTGAYDFHLEFSNAGLPGPMGRGLAAPSPGEAGQPAAAPDLFTALEKQLGLKLEKSKTQLDVIVIDHMDKTPTEN